MRPLNALLLAGIGLLLGLLLFLLLPGEEAEAPAEALAVTAAGEPGTEATPEPAAAVTPAPTADPAEEMSALLADFRDSHEGRWSLWWAEPERGITAFAAADREPMVAASLIKLYIMAAVCREIEDGTLDEAQCAPLLEAMITVSDNASANALIALLGEGDAEAGMAAVNAWCAGNGYVGTSLNRLLLANNGLENYTTGEDCARLLGEILAGRCVSPAQSQRMLALLLAQQVNDRLPALLPEGTLVAHKTGDLSGLCFADVGIVFAPGGAYILCAIVNDPPADGEAIRAIAELSRLVWDRAGAA